MWKNRLLILVVMICGIGLIIGYKGSNLGYIILYSVLMLIVVAAVSALFAPLMVRPKESLSQILTTKNSQTDYQVTIKNRSLLFYPRVQLRFFNDQLVKYHGSKASTGLAPLGDSKITYSISVPYRGVYRAGVKAFIVTDFLGLFKRKINGQNIITITVYPEYDEHSTISILNESQSPALLQDYLKEQDNTAVADVRQYTSFDSQKNIHWALSAKRGELMVKNYSPLVTKRIAVFLDTEQIKLPIEARAQIEDAMVSYVAGGVNYCLKNDLPVTFVYGEETVRQKELSHPYEMEELLEILATVEFSKKYPSTDSLVYFKKDYNNVLYISDIDEKSYGIIQHLITYETKTIVYYFHSDKLVINSEKKEMLDSLVEYGVEVNRIKIT